MTSDDLREIFKNACTAQPLADGWPELEKFGPYSANYTVQEIDDLCAENAKLRTAAQAVIDRWDTPLWKDVPATAVFIEQLRAALEK